MWHVREAAAVDAKATPRSDRDTLRTSHMEDVAILKNQFERTERLGIPMGSDLFNAHGRKLTAARFHRNHGPLPEDAAHFRLPFRFFGTGFSFKAMIILVSIRFVLPSVTSPT